MHVDRVSKPGNRLFKEDSGRTDYSPCWEISITANVEKVQQARLLVLLPLIRAEEMKYRDAGMLRGRNVR